MHITTTGRCRLHTETAEPPEAGTRITIHSARTDRRLICDTERATRQTNAIELELCHKPADYADRQAWLTLMLGDNAALTRAFATRRQRRPMPMALLAVIRQALWAPIRLARVSVQSRHQRHPGDPEPNQPDQEEA